MKHLCLLLAMLVIAQPARASILKEALLEVLQARLEKTVDEDFKSLEYWQDLLSNVANNTPEVTVTQIMDDYELGSIAKDTAISALGKLVPEAAGPIGLLISASDAVHKGTRDMLDFYKERRLTNFMDEVIKPSQTTRELKANYDTFTRDRIDTGQMDTNVLYAEREELLNKMHEVFLQRFRELARKEKAAESRRLAEQAVARKLKAIRAESVFKVQKADEYLGAAGMAASAANIRQFINDPSFAAKVKKAAKDAAKGKQTAVPATTVPTTPVPVTPAGTTTTTTTTGAKKDEKPKEPAKPPSTSGEGGSESGLIKDALQLGAQAEKVQSTRVDYGPFLSLYGEAADRFVTNNISGELFRDAGGETLAAAREAYGRAHGYCKKKEETEACEADFNNFTGRINEINKRIDDMAGSVKAQLEALTKSTGQTPGEYGEQLKKNFEAAYARARDTAESLLNAVRYENHPSLGHESKYSWPGKKDLTLEEMRGRQKQYAGAAGTYASMSSEAERSASSLQEKIRMYEEAFKQRYAEYGDLYAKNTSLAEYAGAKFAAFQKEIDGISRARKMLEEDAYSFVNESYITGLKRSQTLALREADGWKGQIAANEAFIAANTARASTALVQGSITAGKESGKKITREFLNDYYDRNLKEFIRVDVQGALALLNRQTRGTDSRETVSYGDSSINVWQLAETGVYMTLAEHRNKLKEFREKIQDITSMRLAEKQVKLLELGAQAEKEYKALGLKSAETQKLWQDLEQAWALKSVIELAIAPAANYELFYGGGRTLSAPTLTALADQYVADIARCEEIENKMRAVFAKYAATPFNATGASQPSDYLECLAYTDTKKWKLASDINANYLKINQNIRQAFVEEDMKFMPVKSLTVAGKSVDTGGAADVVELGNPDLRGGAVVIEGKLHPEILGELSGLFLSLDGGQTTHSALQVGESFTGSFTPVEGKNYSIKILPRLKDGRKSFPFPGNNREYRVMYVKATNDDIARFYEKFKTAYEGKNDSVVLSYIHDDWDAGDGTTIADLEENIRRSFRMYDEIKFDISNVNVRRPSPGKYEVSYDVTITSRIFDRNLKHEEKSSVVEQIAADGSGKLKIVKTVSGRFWYVK